MINQKLTEVANCAPLIKQMTGLDAAIAVWNTEGEVIAYFKSNKVNINFDVGYKDTDKNSNIHRVLRTGKPSYSKIPKEAFGQAFEGTATPIYDNGEIVGVVTYIYSSEVRDGIINNANALDESITNTNVSINSISENSITLSSNMNEIKTITDSIVDKVNDAIEIVTSIQQNAKLSNILALNASIESARAGDAGKGFAVVSDEMRKFSKASQEASDNISNSLNEITKSLREAKKHIDSSQEVVNDQATSINNLNSIFENVTETAKKTIDVCNKITCI